MPPLRTPLLLLLLTAAGPATAAQQFAVGSAQYNESLAASRANVTVGLELAPGLEEVYFPQLLAPPTSNYVPATAASAAAYTQNVIFDPCRGYAFACCNDTYGTPEYAAYNTRVGDPAYGTLGYFSADGSPLDKSKSRRPDDELFIDEACVAPAEPHINCVMARVAARPYPQMPQCWNYNDSVVADAPCRAPADGSRVDLCIEVAVTQTAFIVECGGAAATSPHCGTFLEVHAAGDPTVLAETRLRGMYPSGYRMSLVSSTYMNAPNRVICSDPIARGRYEIWWIQRTLSSFVVERTLPFTVVSPQCDWDAANNAYFPYATVPPGVIAGDGGSASTSDPFDPALFLFSRPRTVGSPALGRPGKGMGPVMDAPTAASFPPGAQFVAAAATLAGGDVVSADVSGDPDPDPLTYVYTPEGASYGVANGYLEPPDVPPDEYHGGDGADPIPVTPLVVSGGGGRRRRR